MKDVIFGSVNVGAWRSRADAMAYAERQASSFLEKKEGLSYLGVEVEPGWSSLALFGVLAHMAESRRYFP